jgi:hypothetical protein
MNLTPIWTSYTTWIVFLEVLLLYTVYTTFKFSNSLGFPKEIGYLTSSLWFFFSALYLEFYLGQVNLFMGIFMFFSLVALEEKKMVRVSTFWTVSCFSKPVAYMFAPVLLSYKCKKPVKWNLLITGLTNVPFIFFLIQALTQPGLVTPPEVEFYHGDFSLRMFILSFFAGMEIPQQISTLLMLGLMALFLGIALYANIMSRDIWASCTMYACAFFLSFRKVWEHHYNFLIPFIILIIFRTIDSDNLRKKSKVELKDLKYNKKNLAILLLIYILLAIPTPLFWFNTIAGTTIIDDWPTYLTVIYHGTKCIPTLLLFIYTYKISMQQLRDTSFKKSLNIFIDNILGRKKINTNEPSNIPNQPPIAIPNMEKGIVL